MSRWPESGKAVRGFVVRGRSGRAAVCAVLALWLLAIGYSPAAWADGEAGAQLGDLNCDGQVNYDDIGPFALAVSQPAAWCAQYGQTMTGLVDRADLNGDRTVDLNDINGFGALVAASAPPPGPRAGGAGTPGAGRGEPTATPAPIRTTLTYDVDLDVDSDNDNGVEYPERDAYEDEMEANGGWGKFVKLNNDDDDGDGQADMLQSGPIAQEYGELVPMALQIRIMDDAVPAWTPGQTVNLTFANPVGPIHIWQSPRRGDSYIQGEWTEYPYEYPGLGDINCDEHVDSRDIEPFVEAMTGCLNFLTAHPTWYWLAADANQDGTVSWRDIDPFVGLLGSDEVQPCANCARTLWVEGITATEQAHWLIAYADFNGDHIFSSDPQDSVDISVHHQCDVPYFSYGVVPGYPEDCERVPVPPEESRCWLDFGLTTEFSMWEMGENNGHPLHLSRSHGFGPGDFPPLSTNVATSSSPLVPGGVSVNGPRSYPTRAVHEGVVDMITGVPLLQETDFELPFGGAVFRHVRTYSEDFVDHKLSRYGWGIAGAVNAGVISSEASFWDWNGRHWMMSENPILLIDAAYPHLADWQGEPPAGFGVRMCYLILDAHHAIPFIDQTGDGNYVAPDWFDATLEHDGNKQNGEWVENQRPTEFSVRLYGDSVTYSFEPHYEDIHTHLAIDAHAHPQDPVAPGYGVPWYGLVSMVADRYGHEIRYHYPSFEQHPCEDERWAYIDSFPCEGCCQNCNEKGEITAVELVTNGIVQWTLLYTYRSFGAPATGEGSLAGAGWDRIHPHMLHSIHAYEGPMPIPTTARVLRFMDHFAELQAFTSDGGTTPSYDDTFSDAPYENWTLQARYTYQEFGDYVYYYLAPPDTEYWHFARNRVPGGDLDYRQGRSAAYSLVKVEIVRRNGADETTTRSAYRYGVDGYDLFIQGPGSPGLAEVFSVDTCATFGAHMESPPPFNVLLYGAGNVQVRGDDPATPELDETAYVATLADYRLHRNVHNCSIENYNLVLGALATAAGEPLERLLWRWPGMDRMWDRRAVSSTGASIPTGGDDPPQTRIFSFYRLQLAPAEGDPPLWPGGSSHANYHWPYRYRHPYTQDEPDPSWDLPFDQPFHIMVIDEHDPTHPYYDVVNCQGILSRRVVKMNPAGFVLSDRSYNLVDGTSQVHLGFSEKRVYDSLGRVIRACSKGWGSNENPDQSSNGLVRVFAYDGTDRSVKAVGIREGMAGDTKWIEAYEYDPQQSGRVLKAVRFDSPPTGYSPSGPIPPQYDDQATIHSYTLNAHDGIKSHTMRGPGFLPGPGASGLVYPIQKTRNDDNGRMIWSGGGCVDGTGAVVEFYATRTDYDIHGRIERQVFDTRDGNPAGFARAPDMAGLEYTTEYTHEGWQGPKKISYPHASDEPQRIAFYQYTTPPPDYNLVTWEYPSLLVSGQPGDLLCNVLAPIRRTETRNGRPILIQEVMPVGGPVLQYSDWDGPVWEKLPSNYEVLSESRPSFNAGGQMTGAVRSSDGQTLAASVSYYAGSLPSRTVAPDGTITRYTYDRFGRLERTYRGTNDHCLFFGSEPRWCNQMDMWECYESAGCTWDPVGACLSIEDMALIEKRYYGEGLHDADELVTVRHYREKPANQYGRKCTQSDYELFLLHERVCVDPDPASGDWGWYEVAPNEDEIGWTTNYEHDWRMRPVWEFDLAEDGTPLRHTLAWLDQLDRPVVVAEYGNNLAAPPPDAPSTALPAGLDPRWLDSTWDIYGVADFVADLFADPDTRPLSVTRTFYNHREQPWRIQNWFWDQDLGEATCTETVTYYNYADKPVEVHAHNAPIQRYAYDARGRQIRSETVAALSSGDQVVAYTDTLYAANDQATQVARGEYDPAANSGAGGYIESYTNSWYDGSGRITHTAAYGTFPLSGFGVGGVPPTYIYDDPPDPGEDGYLLTKYAYDEAGNQSKIWHPDGTLTQHEYDGFGRLLLTIENAAGTTGTPRRYTAYRYGTAGRLEAMAAVLPEHNGGGITCHNEIDWEATDGTIQVTTFAYDADVCGGNWAMSTTGGTFEPQGFAAESTNPAWISQATYPDGEWLAFAYYPDGSVARRQDSRGVTFYHAYDELGRRTDTWIDDVAAYVIGDYAPAHRVRHLAYTYTARGELDTVIARALVGTQECDVARSVFLYDGFGNLKAEEQTDYLDTLLSPPGSPRTSRVDYVWSVTADHNRLANILYPGAGDATCLTLHYDGDPVSDALNRLTSLSWAQGTLPQGTLAEYDYIGMGRRVGLALGNGAVTQSFGGGGTYAGLDQWGRVRDVHYQGQYGTLHRYEYDYDLMGNRTYARVTQVNADNERSWAYAYDELQRLVDAHMGWLDVSTGQIATQTTTPLERDLAWKLDTLGNWAGNAPDPGFSRTDLLYGVSPEAVDITHAVNIANEITSLTTDDGGTPQTDTFVHDRAGNVVFDGRLFYQYDGFNRLAAVHLAADGQTTWLTVADFDDDGRLEPTATPGPRLVAFDYDAVGRLLRTTRSDRVGNTQVEAYAYDGVRRIQETETTYAPVPAEPTTAVREYVWGPDYTDEAVCLIDCGTGAPPVGPPAIYFYLLDASYNVVGLTDAAGTVLVQYTFEPYGTPAILDEVASGPLPVNRLGHQGLFFERLYAAAAESLLTTPALAPRSLDPSAPSVGLYHNRNRWLSPELGRFLQRDPNETTLPIVTAIAFNGDALAIVLGVFSPQGHYGDGLNLYAYLGSNPVNLRDPLGLVFDPFEDVDDLIGDIQGERAAAGAAAAAQIGMFMNTALMIGKMAFSFMPGADALNLMFLIAQGKQVGWMDILGAGLDLAGPLGKIAGRFGGMLFTYASKGSAIKFGRHGDDYIRGIGKACNCFVAGTPVDTPGGSVPIEELEVGDEVLTRPEGCPECPPQTGRVARVFRRIAPAILWLTLATGEVVGTTPGHEVWTFERGWGPAAELTAGESFLTPAGAAATIVEIIIDPTPTPVYNFEVRGTHTYFAAGVWVHNDSCTWLHHIATNKNWIRSPQWSAKFDALFRKVGMTLNDAENLVPVPPHAGPHSQMYHHWVYKKLSDALEGDPLGARDRFQAALRYIREQIERDASVLWQ